MRTVRARCAPDSCAHGAQRALRVGKEREELLLEARVQRQLRAVPAVPAAALGELCLVVVQASTAFGRALVSLCPLLVGRR
jgi:hypothetical protein